MSMMMESWADHCSSDEEDLKRVPSASAFATIPDEEVSEDDHSDVGLDTSNHGNQKTNFFNQAPPPPPKNIPNTSPFTAFMNNLVYDVSEEQLADEIEKLCMERFNTKIKVVSVRFAKDRETKKRKGFGYVEVDTRDDLVCMLELNPVQMFGRKVRIDVAQNTRRGSNRNNNNPPPPPTRSSSNSLQQMNVPEIDGSKFRGGSIRRSTSKGSSTSLKEEDTKSRPRLKLQPRSKPIESQQASSQSSIFGTGKKREVTSFKPKETSPKNGDKPKPPARTSIKKANKSSKEKKYESNNTNGSKKNKRPIKKTVKEDGWTTSEATEKPVDIPVQEEQIKPKPVVNKVKNKFAALGFDDDSSSD